MRMMFAFRFMNNDDIPPAAFTFFFEGIGVFIYRNCFVNITHYVQHGESQLGNLRCIVQRVIVKLTRLFFRQVIIFLKDLPVTFAAGAFPFSAGPAFKSSTGASQHRYRLLFGLANAQL